METVKQKLLSLINGKRDYKKVDLNTIVQWICELEDGNTYDVIIHRFLKGDYNDYRKEGWFCHITTYEYSEIEKRKVSKGTNMISFGCKDPKEAVIEALKIMFSK